MPRPRTYPPEHVADIIFTYGLCNGNSMQAVEEYRRKYPNRLVPHHTTFVGMFRQLRERGIQANKSERAIGLDIVTENRILNLITEDPTLSTRGVGITCGVSSEAVWRCWKRHNLHPFHYRKVQGLIDNDGFSRVVFCERMNGKLDEDPNFLRKILWTDEAQFTRTGIFNSHNFHNWMEENPHKAWEFSHQHQFSLNMWAGIINDQLIGPIEFPARLHSDMYLNFLRNDLNDLLEDIDLETRRSMWYQHDGAPPHYGLIVRNHLDREFPNRWIGRASPAIQWPPRSPDLTPLDFYLWGTLKNMVYSKPIRSREQLVEKVMEAAEQLKLRPAPLTDQIRKRLNLCLEKDGSHFELFLN